MSGSISQLTNNEYLKQNISIQTDADVPKEIFGHIVSFLENRDILVLASASKQFEAIFILWITRNRYKPALERWQGTMVETVSEHDAMRSLSLSQIQTLPTDLTEFSLIRECFFVTGGKIAQWWSQLEPEVQDKLTEAPSFFSTTFKVSSLFQNNSSFIANQGELLFLSEMLRNVGDVDRADLVMNSQLFEPMH